jgi:hypothetical protein
MREEVPVVEVLEATGVIFANSSLKPFEGLRLIRTQALPVIASSH